ncbi:SEMA6 [Lepeophtheirus salmonis]|uniref:SEMA6 n=1 Tax=Lepeophtheirus salmonis TaxID=72036 RepID=A0A7R8D2Y9_LEPSM|nr:SEMA6 [Lepeophtheirus salmonis]CAF3010020.1 SEMA6 [Lepeophtheirus salmonis]
MELLKDRKQHPRIGCLFQKSKSQNRVLEDVSDPLLHQTIARRKKQGGDEASDSFGETGNSTLVEHPEEEELTEESLSFIRGHSIMDNAVPAFFGGKPLFVSRPICSKWPTQFRVLAVDKQIQSPNGRTYDILFVGTSQGRILKILNTGGGDSLLIEELIVFKEPVEKLHIFRSDPPYSPKLIILSSETVLSIPLARCSSASSCSECVSLQDPYCAWNLEKSYCEELPSSESLLNSPGSHINEGTHLQDVLKGSHKQCPSSRYANEKEDIGKEEALLESSHVDGGEAEDHHHRVIAKSSIILSSSFPNEQPGRNDNGVSSVETPHYSTQELSMAVATSCICALLLGFVIGFFIARARDCSCSRNGENPYHVPYFNQTGYTEDIYAKVDDMTYYPVSSMMMSGSAGGGGGGGTLPGHSHNYPSSATNNTSSTSSSSASSGPQSVSGSKTLSSHYSTSNRPTDFQSFGTVHRSQKIYL